ncbi:FAD-dependent oxidoreductase [Myxococcota bacterium]|nr:FAD-dependent oxidoreductase [Myxococcota bacterium]
MLRILLALLACADPPIPADDRVVESAADSGGRDDSGQGDDTGDSEVTSTPDLPTLSVDLLVIGAGPAGLSAAWAAQETGATVLILEREELAGGSGWYASNFFAAGTRFQADIGVVDSPAQALSEWSGFTGGGDPNDPWVIALAEGSAALVEELVDVWGVDFEGVKSDLTMGPTPRQHHLAVDGAGPVGPLVDANAEVTWLNTEAEALVTEGERVIGARYADLVTGERGWVEAKATLVATGGFARDLDRVLDDRPELQGCTLVFESAPHAKGLGLDLVTAATDAATTLRGDHGIYVHSIRDPRPGFEGEALWLLGLQQSVIVNLNGERVVNEQEIQSFQLVETLVASPDKRLLALLPPAMAQTRLGVMPMYNVGEDGDMDFTMDELIEMGVAARFEDLSTLAAELGLPADTLEATMDRYDDHVAAKIDADFGKERAYLTTFMSGPYYVVELLPGSAKSFGGLALDPEGRVLNNNGEAIPGLFAAGEVAGMLGTAALGEGMGGSITAVYLTGQRAGAAAAAEALQE